MSESASPPPVPGDLAIASALLMTAVSGFIDASLFLRYQIFAFAQTGNAVLLPVALVEGHSWTTYLWPLLAYLGGVAAAQAVRALEPSLPPLVMLEVMLGQVAVFAVLALLPATTPAAVFACTLSFVGGVRVDLFRRAGGVSLVTIAATGNLMRMVQAVVATAQERTPTRWRIASLSSLVVAAFLVGALLGALAAVHLGPHALWGAVVLEAAAVVTYGVMLRRRARRRAAA